MEPWGSEERERIQHELNQFLGPELVSTRPLRADSDETVLHYLTIQQACSLASDIFGQENWSLEVRWESIEDCYEIDGNGDRAETQQSGSKPNGAAIGRRRRIEEPREYAAEITSCVRVTLRDGTFREDLGYSYAKGGTRDVALSKAKSFAKSDATKRALRQFGQVLGNCLYDSEYTSRLVTLASNEYYY